MSLDTLALSLAVERLNRNYELARNRIDAANSQMPWWGGPIPLPEECTDRNGRYILLDAAVALVQAQAALVNARRTA